MKCLPCELMRFFRWLTHLRYDDPEWTSDIGKVVTRDLNQKMQQSLNDWRKDASQKGALSSIHSPDWRRKLAWRLVKQLLIYETSLLVFAFLFCVFLPDAVSGSSERFTAGRLNFHTGRLIFHTVLFSIRVCRMKFLSRVVLSWSKF